MSEPTCQAGKELEAENVLMNELISDQKKRIEELEKVVNRLSAVLIRVHGADPTSVRNLVDG